MPIKKESWKAARRAAAQAFGADPEEIMIELDGEVVIVNWQQSMKVTREVRRKVEEEVKKVLPPEHKNKIVSVVLPKPQRSTMASESRAEQLKKHNPVAFKEASAIYEVLSRHVAKAHRIGPALSSLDSFCDLYFILIADAKDWARIKVASSGKSEIWIGFYHPTIDAFGFEFLRPKDRGEYGTQLARWFLAGAEELAKFSDDDLARAFSGYRE